MINVIKILIALLLFGCLLNMPYGYFQFVRFISMAGFSYIAYFSFESGNKNGILFYFLLALLFQPFIKISLGRELWNIVDVVIGFWLIFSVLYKSKLKS